VDERAGRLAAIARVDAAGAEVRAAFAEAGIDCILLKGRSFAHRLYDAIWERPYSDTDLLIRLADRDRAESALADLGYARVDRDADRLGAPAYAHTFARADGALIDLHWNLSGVSASPERTWAALVGRTESLEVGARPARVLNDEATALMTALHNAHHGARWERAVPDLERAIERLSPRSWTAAAALAGELGADEAFAAGLSLSPAGAELATRIGLASAISLEYRLRAGEISYGAWALHRIRTARGARARMRVLAQVVVPPPSAMRQFFPLARRGWRGLAAAYLLRPLRLMIAAGPTAAEYVRARRSGGGEESRRGRG
jgi:hypothetical protein